MWYDQDEVMRRTEAVKARTHNMDEESAKLEIQKDMEEGWQIIQDTVLAFKVGPGILNGGRFDTLSLGTWLEIFSAANIPHVPAYMAGLLPTMEMLNTLEFPIDPPPLPEFKNGGGMVRVDSCSGAMLKNLSEFGYDDSKRAQGTYVERDGQYFLKMDERLVNASLSYVGQSYGAGKSDMPVWWRPWIPALKQKKLLDIKMFGKMLKSYAGAVEWPIEWRVFVNKGEVIGVSNYYPQVALDMTAEILQYAYQARSFAQELIRFMQEHNIQPWHPRYIGVRDENELSFTVDFISTEYGPIALEAGPAVPLDEYQIPERKWGAHPCCFEGKTINGIQLNR